MFTGLVESVCNVRSAASMRLTVDLGSLSNDAKIGDSIAVNGVCLTITKLAGNNADFDISNETFSKSTLGKLKSSDSVNIERAIKPSSRLGGHFVQGHVDGIAVIKSINKKKQFTDMTFSANDELLNQMVKKGSVAINGISLTITEIKDKTFSVSLVPQTISCTTLANARVGNEVNIENDIIVKAVKAQLANILPTQQSLTVDKLKQLGF